MDKITTLASPNCWNFTAYEKWNEYHEQYKRHSKTTQASSLSMVASFQASKKIRSWYSKCQWTFEGVVSTFWSGCVCRGYGWLVGKLTMMSLLKPKWSMLSNWQSTNPKTPCDPRTTAKNFSMGKGILLKTKRSGTLSMWSHLKRWEMPHMQEQNIKSLGGEVLIFFNKTL